LKLFYNNVAGQSLGRLEALSDGIFAVAMTLLVLNLNVPTSTVIQVVQPIWASGALKHEGELWGKLGELAPRLLTYFLSFMTLGIFWVGQQTQLNKFIRSDRNLAWIHLTFLLAVSITPFSTGLLANFITYRLALVEYWLNIFFLGAVLFASWKYAEYQKLIKDEVSKEMRSATQRRIVIAQSLYAFGILLCIINTYVSIGFIVLVQLNYAIAPRIYPLDRI
jgi:uncharacterized membrane protein